ncbi:MAG: ABC transporter permease subunit [Burkholderiales bacterium]|nr:ABC transporter permease subunit [Burkholderiales bacterium]MDE1926888.1 ABC transporter permease subunit [Burkholderiales bacterium]MDE2159760.1 ABC transporter permease subunit [Burkholderiales bacterium]MDE2505084.1 ABC transporter permease subunit [Burkholderiales bacterium]
MDQISAMLKRAMPFQMASEELLDDIAAQSRLKSYAPGQMIYDRGDVADFVHIVSKGAVLHELRVGESETDIARVMRPGDVFGWAAVLEGERRRLARTTAQEATEVIQIDGETLMSLIRREPAAGDVIMSRFATMITREFDAPESVAARVPHLLTKTQGDGVGSGWALTAFRIAQWLRSPKPYLMVAGFAFMLAFWYLTVEVWKLPRFRDMPGLTRVVHEFLSRNPTYGLSIWTPEYYQHIWASVRRVTIAFVIATALGVPLGLFLGWSERFREYVFPVFETLRPIPVLAWVPLAILMFTGSETPVIFLTFLASFFATALNTMLGVESIDESYSRAAYCLGASKWQVFREVVVPGAMPFIFTGLQISVGVAWFSLVAGEMVSGEFGLGYVINTSYTMVRYPTIVIGMATLGAVGYATSAVVRLAGDYLMQWRVRELALGGR